MTGPAIVLALCRFGQDAAASLLWGTSIYLCTLVPSGLATVVWRRLRVWTIAMGAVVAVSVAMKCPADVAGIGDGWADALDPGVLRGVIVDTTVGRAWMAQAACVLLLAAAVSIPPRRIGAAALASGLLLGCLGLEGHAAARGGAIGLLLRADDILHVWAGGAWLGSLVPVLLILKAADHGELRDEAASALGAFSRFGHVAVALVLLSGALATALIAQRWPVDVASPYDVLLDAKILCVLAMAGLALVNRYVLVPRLALHPEAAGLALRFGTLAEVPLGLAALALVAVFGQMDPS